MRIGYILLATIFVAVTACTEEELTTLNSTAVVAPTTSDNDVVLTKDQAEADVLTISWPKPDYGFSASPTYFIYLDGPDGDFGEGAIVLNNGGGLSRTLTGAELNRHLIALEFEPEVASSLKIRIESRLGPSKSIYSETMTVSATAYTAFLDLSTNWGIVGSGYNDWGNAFPDAPFYTSKTPNVIVAYVTLVDGFIKFRENNEWTNNVGDSGGDGTLETNGSDIPVTAGHYKISWNTQNNTYTIVPFSWGIVGSAYNDWGNAGPDFKFTYDDATDQWRAIVKLQDGAFKIRKNNDWGTNYGDTGADGTLELNGADMTITAGKYLVTFNENESTIAIEPITNIWGLVGSAYNNWGNDGPDAQFERDWRTDDGWILKNVQLLDGAFKFRDANDWAVNYGDSGADGTLELNGSDIVAEAGYYTITLDFSNPASPTWTSVKH